MEVKANYKSPIQPKTLAELLPGLKGILSKNSIQSLTAKKQSRSTITQTRTAEKVFRPLTLAEMRADLRALKVKSPKPTQPATSTRKKNWNSSTKLEHKTKSCTADGQLKQSSVRKVLDFHTRAATISRTTIMVPETPKFPKPESRPKKTLHNIHAKNIRISGICKIPETPTLSNKIAKNRMTIANKENNSLLDNKKKKFETPKTIIRKNVVSNFKTTPLSNLSFKSNSDASFLQKEKEINDIEEKIKAISEEATLEKIAEVSPPASTPFKEYRSIQEYFNKTNETDNSTLYNDNTIMCFDNISENRTIKRDESVIVSLCDLLNKATVSSDKNAQHINTELEDLLDVEKQTENDLRMIDNAILTLNNIKQSQLKSLKNVRKLISLKKSECTSQTQNKQLSMQNADDSSTKDKNNDKMHFKEEIVTPEKNKIPFSIDALTINVPTNRPSVIKSKSPSYKIPKKNACLRKKVFYKSMPNVSEKLQTPPKESDDKAFNMYMQMKAKMNFLNTPIIKHHVGAANTPARTSQNLKMQLDKLFNCS